MGIFAITLYHKHYLVFRIILSDKCPWATLLLNAHLVAKRRNIVSAGNLFSFTNSVLYENQ